MYIHLYPHLYHLYLYFQLLKGKAEVKANVQCVERRFGHFGRGMFQWMSSSKQIQNNGKIPQIIEVSEASTDKKWLGMMDLKKDSIT